MYMLHLFQVSRIIRRDIRARFSPLLCNWINHVPEPEKDLYLISL